MFEKPAMQRAGLSSATSLARLSAISLDTETTGLVVARARVIEIGACRLSDGDIVAGDDYAQLVDPQEPIPARSTAVHGIKDADVAGQPRFRAAARRFAKWAGGAIVIGYSIGFDLAILERECRRANLEWVAPRSLDVRHLVSALGPSLPDNALDTVAAWLGVEITGRHRALGDAVATAKVLRALVPRLAERGIRTLAEAEAAARNHRQRFPGEVEAGWHEAVRSSQLARASVSELARIDSYPYRHRVRDVMSAPPITVSAATALAEVLKILIERRCSSVFVEPAGADPSWAIVTERDLLRVIHADPLTGLTRTAGEAASRPLETVPADAFLYRAIGRMARRGYRHLAAADATGNIVGAVTTRNLLGQRAQDAISLGDAIEEAQTPDALGQVWARLALVAKALVGEEVDARDVAAVASHELCALTRRAAQIAERDMAVDGFGPPPVPYALMVLGSGGRGESLLAMDQDNAIVYASGEPDGPEDRWMAELGRRVGDHLNLAGVPYCQGGVMARNPEWRLSQAGWRDRIGTWLTRSRPQDVLSSDIFFDAVVVHGEPAMGEVLHRDALAAAGKARNFLRLMAMNAADVAVPLGWFGRFRLSAGRMDLKKGGIMPIFSAARVLALTHGLKARSTPERLEGARGVKDVPEAVIDNLIEAHRILLGAILRQQLVDIELGVALSNRVAPGDLPAAARERLGWALAQVHSVPSLLGDPVSAL